MQVISSPKLNVFLVRKEDPVRRMFGLPDKVLMFEYVLKIYMIDNPTLGYYVDEEGNRVRNKKIIHILDEYRHKNK